MNNSWGKLPLLVGNLLLGGGSSLVSFLAVLLLPGLSTRRRAVLVGGGSLAVVLNGVELVFLSSLELSRWEACTNTSS